MSGFAAISGEPDGQPLLPPIALTDEATGLAAAFATMVALRSGTGQVVDVNLLDTMFHFMGPLPSVYALRGEQQPRLGSGLPYSVPRGTYLCADDRWIAVSSSSESVAARVLDLLGLGDDERFATFAGRMEHRDELDAAMVAWCSTRESNAALSTLEQAHVACGQVMDMADIAGDRHYHDRETITQVPDHDGLTTPMQNLIARLSATPGAVRFAGRAIDADGAEIRSNGWTRPG